MEKQKEIEGKKSELGEGNEGEKDGDGEREEDEESEEEDNPISKVDYSSLLSSPSNHLPLFPLLSSLLSPSPLSSPSSLLSQRGYVHSKTQGKHIWKKRWVTVQEGKISVWVNHRANFPKYELGLDGWRVNSDKEGNSL